MTQRAEQKALSQRQILDAAAARLRREGLGGAGIAKVMRDAGLTHGAFYAHFDNKDELTAEAFRHALAENRQRWTRKSTDRSWPARLKRLAARYLTPAHRDELVDSCALSALASDMARGRGELKQVYEEELQKTLRAILGSGDGTAAEQLDDALAFMALCIGGINLARAVADPALSQRVLQACRAAAERITEYKQGESE